jgi:hypothetical protein
MNIKKILVSLMLSFAISLVLSVVATLLWNLIIRKAGAVVDWKTSFMLALIIGVFIPFSRSRDK